MLLSRCLAPAGVLFFLSSSICADGRSISFDRLVLSEEFFSEGACFVDVDGDGDNDVVSGPHWYSGPSFRERHAYASQSAVPIKAYSEFFFTYAHDFNGDRRPDILAIGMPGNTAHWFENPGRVDGLWKKHAAIDDVGNESPELVDITGDGRPELVCVRAGAFGYAEPVWKAPTERWTFTPITPARGFGRFTHGLGVGDVDGDGRLDLLETSGWWEQTPTKGELFRFHAVRFAEAGGAQMFAYDIDGDGDNDVVSVQNAHGYGLAWFEQRRDGGKVSFVRHDILTARSADSPWGLSISQMHALALVDIDRDGVKDLVTGKRYFAHGGGDPGSHQLAVLYWFRTLRGDGGVEFEPRLIEKRCGVGTQLVVGDVSGDGYADIVVGNKLGTSVLINRPRTVGDAELAALRPARRSSPAHVAGTGIFAGHVRGTEPLDPEAERRTFVLPPGFEAQLFVAEPDIAKPMNLAFDARGRLWVSSSVEYPFAAPADREGRDTIKVLEDADGDGRADRVTTFADGLNIPIGLYPCEDGVICWSIPNIWRLRDTDGDGRADRREVLYGPFGYERDQHGMCNAFTRGPDGWVYACHGFSNVSTVSGRDGHQVRMQSGNTFRFRIDGSRIEHYTFGQVNPFGLTFDRHGDIFTADCHTRPITMLIAGGYSESFGAPHDGLGFVPRVMEHQHGSTALCGIALGEATSFPPVYGSSVFHGNVTACRINRNTLHRSGASVRAREESDFLVAGDPWFRPVDLQVGPDGALWVADFYNRIIGHYEVPLTHPGRDRHRGRIWRIVYRGGDERRDAPAVSAKSAAEPRDLTALSVAGLLEELASPSGSRAMPALDRLTDGVGPAAVDAVRGALPGAAPGARALLLWALSRWEKLTADDLEAALADGSALVRVHAVRMIAAMESPPARAVDWLIAALVDDEPLVRRAATDACSRHPSPRLLRPLLDAVEATPSGDPHLEFATRRAVRDALRDEAVFRSVTRGELGSSRTRLVMGLCLSLKTPAAGVFVLRNLEHLEPEPPGRVREFLTFATRHVSRKSVAEVVAFARTRYASDIEFQLELLSSVQDGLAGRGVREAPAVRRWALALARELLGVDEDGKLVGAATARSIAWTFVPYRGKPDRGNPWVLSTRRGSADGVARTLLYSSFPRGEAMTGIHRSGPFELTERLEFFLAGHDGPPPDPVRGKNLVRLRDAVSHTVLRRVTPPRNDTAQRVRWNTSAWKGRRAYLELVDGDTGSAFAWLAAGRFSVQGLNPSRLPERRRQAAGLVQRFVLDELRRPIVELLRGGSCGPDSLVALGRSVVILAPDVRLAALAETPRLVGADAKLVRRSLDTLIAGRGEVAVEVLADVMRVASAGEQLKLAGILSSERRGVETLLQLVDKGRASATLLRRAGVSQKLAGSASVAQKKRVDSIVAELPDDDARLVELIAGRRGSYMTRGGAAAKGRELFVETCAPCHRVGDVGKSFAPNLDGIGSRGLDRVLEDVLAPNRNVDVAFRATTIVTTKGRVLTGLLRPSDGARLLLVDGEGKELSIPEDDVASKTPSTFSPMPANLGETFGDDQLRDLLAYLLSLRGG